MFSDLLKSAADQYVKNLPFVIYRKPKEQKVRVIFQDDVQEHHIKNFEETGFVFAPFDKTRPSNLLVADRIIDADYSSKTNSKIEFESGDDYVDAQKEFHLNLVQKGITEIKANTFKKVVLSRVLEVKCETAPLALFQNLLDKYSNAFCYLWHHPKVGTWLGATPEILLRTENQRLTTMSLAGTQKYLEDQLPEWGKKEIDEQQLVTNYISDALKSTIPNLFISNRESVRAGNLWHLRTKLTGTFDKGNLKTIIEALHPTPAVCGLPMLAAKNFILDQERYNRQYYTGYLGELNFKVERDRSSSRKNQENKAYKTIKNTTTLFVNLRCMQIMEKVANIYIGGGVTKDSDPNKEWRETVAKSRTMLQVFE